MHMAFARVRDKGKYTWGMRITSLDNARKGNVSEGPIWEYGDVVSGYCTGALSIGRDTERIATSKSLGTCPRCCSYTRSKISKKVCRAKE